MANFRFELRNLLHNPTMLGFIVMFCLILIMPNAKRFQPSVGYADEESSFTSELAQIGTQLDDWEKQPPVTSPTHPSVAELHQLATKIVDITTAMDAKPLNSKRVMRAKLDYYQLVRKGAQDGWTKFVPDITVSRAKIRVLTYLLNHGLAEFPENSTNLPALNQMQQNITNLISMPIILAFIGIWCGTILIEDKRRRVNSLLTLMPVRQARLLLNKLGSFLAVGLGGMLLAFAIELLVPLLTSGVGTPAYPVAYSIDGQRVLLKSTGRLVLEQCGSLMLLLVVFAVIAVFIQLFTRNVLVSVLGMLLVALEGNTTTANWLPSSYFNVNILLNSITHSVQIGTIACVLVLTSSALLAISLIIVHWRQRI